VGKVSQILYEPTFVLSQSALIETYMKQR